MNEARHHQHQQQEQQQQQQLQQQQEESSGSSSSTTKLTRETSPKSVINPPFTSHPSSTSGSMEHRQADVPLPSAFEAEKVVKNPFSSHAVDPLCRITLKETAEFVKSLPVGAEAKQGTRSSVPRRLDSLGSPVRGGGAEMMSPLVPLRTCFMNTGFPRKPFPSKWDDAQKWLASSSSVESPSHAILARFKNTPPKSPDSGKELVTRKDLVQLPVLDQFRAPSVDAKRNNNNGCFSMALGSVTSSVSSSVYSGDINFSSSICSLPSENGHVYPVFPSMKDKFEDKVEPAKGQRYDGLMKDAATEAVVGCVQHRDMGTETTPLGSSCHTPVKSGSSPARHNTPASRSGLLSCSSVVVGGIDIEELEKRHFEDLELVQGLPSGIQFNSLDKSVSVWSSREEEEEEISKSLRHFDINECKKNILDARASSWEEAETSKCLTRYQREEARIEAWINLQNAKAEAETKKLEVKIEKMRSNLEEKLMKKMAGAHKRAEEWRLAAKAQRTEQLAKTAERAERMRKDSHVSFNFTSCSCFSCRGSS